MSSKVTRFKLHKSHKRWVILGVSAVALLGGLMQAKPVHAAQNSVGTVNYLSGWNTVVWQRDNGLHMTNKWLPTDSRWRTYGAIKSSDGQYFLNVGGNQWVGDKYFDLDDETSWQTLRGVVTVTGAAGSGVPVWNSPYADRSQTNHAPLANGSRWQTYLRAVVNGQTWYNLGGKQWIQGQYAKITHEQLRGPKHYISGAPSLIDDGGTTVAVKTHYSVVAKDVYGNILQTNFFTANVGNRAYVNAPTIPGYDVLAPSSQSIVLGNDTNQNEVIFKYTPRYVPPTTPVTPQHTTVHIKIVDPDGKTITTLSKDTTVGSHFVYQGPTSVTGDDGQTYERVGEGIVDLPNVTGNETPTLTYQLKQPVPEKTTVPVNAVDKTGKSIGYDLPKVTIANDKLDGYVYTVPEGQQTVTAKDGTKYQATAATFAITQNEDKSYEINVVYEPVVTTTDVPVNAVDKTGKSIGYDLPKVTIANDKLDGYTYTVPAGQQTITLKDGTKYQATAAEFAIKKNTDGSHEINVVYEPVPTTTDVPVNAVDKTGKSIGYDLPKVTIANDKLDGYVYTVPEGQQTVTAKDGTKYQATAATFAITQNEDKSYEINVVYEPVVTTTDVPVNAVDKTGKSIGYDLPKVTIANDKLDGYIYTVPADQQTVTAKDGTKYQATAATFAITQNEDKSYEINVVYEPVPTTTDVPVNAVDKTGKSIGYDLPKVTIANDKLDGYVYTVPEGQQTVTAKDGTKYQATAATFAITQNEDKSYEINVVYEPVPTTTDVPVNAVDKTGKSIGYDLPKVTIANDKLEGYVYTVPEGQQTVTAKDGTKYQATAAEFAIKKNTDGSYEINVVYEPVPTTTDVPVNAVDKTGKSIGYDLPKVTIANDKLDGYTYTVPAGQQTITLKDGTKYQATAAEFAIKKNTDGSYEINVVYEPVPTTTDVPVNAVDKTGKSIGYDLPKVTIANDKLDGYVYTVPEGQQTVTAKDGTKYQATAATFAITQNEDKSYEINVVYEPVPTKQFTVTVNAVDRMNPNVVLTTLHTELVAANGELDYDIPIAQQEYINPRTGDRYKLVDPVKVSKTDITKDTAISVQYALQVTLTWNAVYSFKGPDGKPDSTTIQAGIKTITTNQSDQTPVTYDPTERPTIVYDGVTYKLRDTKKSSVLPLGDVDTGIQYEPDTTK